MTTNVDVRFEQAMCDHWWVQDNAEIVRRPEIEYLVGHKNTGLYNAVVRVDPNHQDVDGLVQEVLHAHQGKESAWRIGAPSYTDKLKQHLLREEYHLEGTADAWVVDVNSSRPATPDNLVIKKVESVLQLRDMDLVMSRSFPSMPPNNVKENSPYKPAVEYKKELWMCTGPNARCLRFVAYDKKSNQPLSTGGVNLFPKLGLAFMWAGCTVPEARGRGVYSALVTERMRHARSHGIQPLGLYAMRDTSGPIVQAQGFEKHGPVYFFERKR